MLSHDTTDSKFNEETCKSKLERLEKFLHSEMCHPDFEYKTMKGPRKAFDNDPPFGEGWERNIDYGRDGWERFDYHEEGYWKRLKPCLPPDAKT